MTVDFTEYFWGERNEGYSVLYSNMKNGATAAKELHEMLRDLARVQEDAAKAHSKVVKQLGTSGHCGSFGPMLVAFKSSAEKAANAFNTCHVKVSDVAREVQRYQDELLKRHKRVKEEEATTLEAVKAIQETTAMLQKSKEVYKQRLLEAERLRRESSSGPKDLEKAETKYRRAQEEYKALVDRYCIVREVFQGKFMESTRRFQQHETEHLESMRKFVERYLEIADDGNSQWSRIQGELQIAIAGLTTAHLLEQFALAKYTGLEKPGSVEFEETPGSNPTGPPSDISDRSGNSADKLSLGAGSVGAQSANSAGGTPLSGTGAMRKESSGSSGKTPSESRMRSWSGRTTSMQLPAGAGASAGKKEQLHLETSAAAAVTAGTTSTPTPSKISARASSLLNLFVSSSNSNNNSAMQQQQPGSSSKRKSPSEPPSPTAAAASELASHSAHPPMLTMMSVPPTASEGWRGSKSHLTAANASASAIAQSSPKLPPKSPKLPSKSPSKASEPTHPTSSPIPLPKKAPIASEELPSSSPCGSEGPPLGTPPPPPVVTSEEKHDNVSCSIVIDDGEGNESKETEQLPPPSPAALPKPGASPVPAHSSPKASPKTSPYASITGWTGFLRRGKKKKDGSGKKTKTSDGDADSLKGQSGGEQQQQQQGTPLGGGSEQLDEDGYSRQPQSGGPGDTAPSDPWADFNKKEKNFYSSSDDSDDDDMKKKIKVEIKPIHAVANESNSAISASVDELRTAVGALELVPPPASRMRPQSALNDRIIIGSGSQTLRLKPKPRAGADGLTILDPLDPAAALRRSHSQSHVNRPSNDLLGLSLHPIDNIDEPETPTKTAAATGATPGKLDISAASSTSKEIRDIFNDIQDLANTSTTSQQKQQQPQPGQQGTPKQGEARPSSVVRERITNSLIALPRPPSRHGTAILATAAPSSGAEAAGGTGVRATAKLSLARQGSSSDRSASASPSADVMQPSTLPRHSAFGTSRGPSPLTLGMSEVVPLAVAFQEVCHACFRGAEESMCQVRLIGDMMVSFPAGIVSVLANNVNPAPLRFRIKNASVLESVIPNKHLISQVPTLSTNDVTTFEFNMTHLRELLRKQSEQNSNASYFNIDILKYQIRSRGGASSCPLQMVAYWKCSRDHTDLRLDYKYNGHAMAAANPLRNISISVPIDGGVQNMQSKPNGVWMAENNRALWKFPEFSTSTNGDGGNTSVFTNNGGSSTGLGSLRARFELASGPGSQGTIAAQFNCEGTTLSGVEFELVGHGYRLSLVKKRFVSGKYVCDGDVSSSSAAGGDENRSRYAAVPAAISTSDGTDGGGSGTD